MNGMDTLEKGQWKAANPARELEHNRWGEAGSDAVFQKRRLGGHLIAILNYVLEGRLKYTAKRQKATVTSYIKGNPSWG